MSSKWHCVLCGEDIASGVYCRECLDREAPDNPEDLDAAGALFNQLLDEELGLKPKDPERAAALFTRVEKDMKLR